MEALTASQDSENRITIGGKRKSSSRRSSILKATKSPLKAGVLEDLDPNSLDDNGRSRSKKSRRSSGRRVSFAEKNDIKEFFVEDWKSTWNKDTDDSNLQVPNSASQGEYRKPAESIQGLESLLKGDIQAEDNQMCKVELQEMPDVQYNQLSMTNEVNAVSYDRGILLQTVTDSQAQHTVPLDVTICRGAGIIGANPSDHAEEMEYTKCHSSVLPSAVTNTDRTRIFSEDPAIELDVTCTQQEIFFRDYPNAQLSSPDSLEQSDKMDSRSFLMSLASKPLSTQTNEETGPKEFSASTSIGNAYRKRQPLSEITDMQSSMERKQGGDQNGAQQQVPNFDDNVELTACHGYKVLENSVPKTNRRSIYEPADIDVTSCYGPGLMKLPDKQECQGPDGVSVLRSQTSRETTNLNTRRSTFETDMQAQSHPEYTAQLDVTSCYGNGILPGKRSVVPGVDQTVVFTTNSVNTHSLDLTVCQGQEGNDSDENLELTACHSYEVLDNSIPKTSQKSICEPADLDVTSCYGPGLIKSPAKQITSSYEEHTGQVDTTRCYGKGILPSKRLPVPGSDQTMVFAANTDGTESLDFTVCQPQQGHAAVMPLPGSLSQNNQNDHSFSHGSGKMDSSAFLKSLCATPHSSAANNETHDLPGSEDVSELRNLTPGAMTSANANRNSFEKEFRALQLEEQTGLVDTTRCYGKGILPNKRLSVAGADQTMVFAANTDNTESLDYTVCQPQQGLPFAASPSQNYQSDHQSSFHGSGKMDSSLFLKSLNATPHSSATRNDEYDDEMDLTTSVPTGALTGEEMLDQNRPVKSMLSMESNLSCTKTNENTKVSPSSSSFRNAYLIKNPFSKTTDVQEPTLHFDENVELTVCHSKPVPDNSMQQKAKRRSVYEPADIDVTSCYGPGLLQSPEKEETSDVCKSALNLSRSLRAATIANRFSGNVTLNTTQDLHGWNTTQQQQSDFNENLELTTSQGRQFISNNSQKTNRRSIYEPADIDVTSCHGVGLVNSSGENLELASSYSQQVLDKSLQKASRRSLYEPAEIDVTSCHGPGLVKSSGENLELTVSQNQPVLDKSSQRANRRSLYEPADVDVTSCHGPGLVIPSGENLEFTGPHSQPVLDNSTQRTNRRSFYKPADVDVTSCHGPGLVTSGENLELTGHPSQPVLDNSTQRTNRRSLYEPAEIDVTSCHGPGLVTSGETLELTVPHSQPDLNNSTQITNRRSFYEPAEIDVTSCHGVGLVNSSGDNLELTGPDIQPVLDNSAQRTNRRSFYEPAEIDVTSCHGAGLVKSSGDNLELTVPHVHPILDNSTQRTNRHSLYEPAEIDVTSCHGIENSEPTVSHSQYADDNTQQTSRQSPCELSDVDATSFQGEQDVISNHFSETALNLTKVPETSFRQVNDNATLNQAEDLHDSEEILQTSRVAANPNSNFESTDYSADTDMTSSHAPELDKSTDNQITSDAIDRKLSIICEESVSELCKKEMSEDANVTEVEEMQNTTQSPITLKQFLDITEIAFITEVNMRRSIAPSNLVEAPKTTKDMIISSLVSQPKAACYEEAIPAIEAEITNMKEKVEQQEMELNASNPRVFMEAQSASKEELLEMQSKVRRLRSVCEKTTKREWKEGKGQLNKRILSKIKENHQALASDVHIVEESLSMVDDCLNLLDKMDNDLHEGIQSIRQSLEENEKKLQEQTTMVEQLEIMTEALKKSEQELADLESKRSTMQSEKQELASRKEQLDAQILENEEAIRLLKNKDPRSEDAATKALSQKLDILESLQEWSLEKWDKERARFTFLKSSLEMVVLFSSEISDSEGSSPNQEVKSIELNFTSADEFTGKMGKVHTLVKQAVNQDILTQMCHSKKDLTKVLEHMSEIIFKSNQIGQELFRIGLSHLMSFKENRFVVEFSSLKAFVKFVLYIQLDLQSYPDGVTFTVSSMIGQLSQTEIGEALNSVDAGPRYLCRLVEAADQLLNKAKPTSNMPS